VTQLIESWVESANIEESNFPLNNLPYGVFSTPGTKPRCATALGHFVVDLQVLEEEKLLDSQGVFAEGSLNPFMELGPEIWSRVRQQLTDLFSKSVDPSTIERITDLALVKADGCRLHMPFKVAEFTDFYAGRNHATNVGTLLRGAENALPPNWLHMPIGYNGRASTVVVSGTDVTRPCGQLKSPDHDTPIFAPSRRLDIELEMGAIVGRSSQMGSRLTVAQADEAIFGYVLLNDWSARDIQAWEYQPLGPFQAKAFATSISPWIVTKAALEPFRADGPERDYPLLDHLLEPGPMFYDVNLEVVMTPASSEQSSVISKTNFRELYYSSAQQLAHHSSSGCAMNVGDLLGSGTISGKEKNECGSLLEMTWGGQDQLELDCGEKRSFLQDDDSICLRGYASAEGFRIGFGDCEGKILPAID